MKKFFKFFIKNGYVFGFSILSLIIYGAIIDGVTWLILPLLIPKLALTYHLIASFKKFNKWNTK